MTTSTASSNNSLLSNTTGISSSDESSMRDTMFYLYGYLIFALVALIVSVFRSIMLLVAAVRAATVTFSKLIRSLSRAPMSWYDQTPAGRILNRVSSDQQRVDERVPQLLRDTVDTLLRVFGTVCLVAVFSPWFLCLCRLWGFSLQTPIDVPQEHTRAQTYGQYF